MTDQTTAEPGRRDRLAQLLASQALVTVTNPRHPGSAWTGRITAIADDPSVILDCPGGLRVCLPQSFGVTEAAVTEAAGDENEPSGADTGPQEAAERAQLAVAEAALRRLALDEPMTVYAFQRAVAEAAARREYAAGTLETIARLAPAGAAPMRRAAP